MQFRHLACAAILALAVATPGCGGDDDDDQNGGPEADAITEAATAVITDPEKSCSLLTDKALEVFTGAKGQQAETECEEQVSNGQLPDSATVKVISTAGDSASVGYVTNQVTGAMILVKVDGQWLMDSVTTLPE